MTRVFQLKKAEILILASMIFSVSITSYLYFFEHHPPRYCDEKKRVLTYEELIIAALENKYKYKAIKTDDSTKTPQDFYKKYPFCCTVERITLDGKTDPGYVYVELFFPTGDIVLANANRFDCDSLDKDACLKLHNVDKEELYTKERVPVSDCGGVGSGPSKDLNIKDTPFGNDHMKSLNLLRLEFVHKLERDKHGS